MKRKTVPKSIRFEVFKRDKFTCQYCGAQAPDVILEVDHITPVSKGGDDSVLNLITSCRDCNRGKGKRELKDDSVVKKQKKALDDLQDRKEIVEMMGKWKMGLIEQENNEIEMVNDYIGSISKWGLSDTAKENIRKLIRNFGFQNVYEATETAYEKYFYGDERSWDIAFRKIGGICYNRKIGRKADYYA